MQLRKYQKEAVIHSLKDVLTKAQSTPVVVLPCGAGKSVVIAETVRLWLQKRQSRVICFAHKSKLLRQNADKLLSIAPDLKPHSAFYSAQIGEKTEFKPITFASIQSFARSKMDQWRNVGLILIDEAHLVPVKDVGQYRKAIAALRKINPNLSIIGYTATPHRMDSGPITSRDGIFSHICYEKKIMEMITEGFLSPLVSAPDVYKIDVSKVPTISNDYHVKKLSDTSSDPDAIRQIMLQIKQRTKDRQTCIVFAVDIAHAELVNNALNSTIGISKLITQDTSEAERNRIYKDFSEGKVKFLVNVDIATTGVDISEIDCIIALRATQSIPLWVQMLGRGTRLSPGKENCLVLDFAGNIDRLGPLNDLKTAPPRKKTKPGEAPTKLCPECSAEVHLSTLDCEWCGFHWEKLTTGLYRYASEADVLQYTHEQKYVCPDRYECTVHKKHGSPDSIKFTYISDTGYSVSEWICPEHSGRSISNLARHWIGTNLDVRLVGKTARYVVEKVNEHPEMLKLPKKITYVNTMRGKRILNKFYEEVDVDIESEDTGRVDDRQSSG